MIFPGNKDYVGRHAGAYDPSTNPWRFLPPVLIAIAVLCLLAWPFLEAMMPVVTEDTLLCADLPASIGELRIVYVSDIHAGPFLGRSRVLDLVTHINMLNPDIVLLGGDYAQDSTTAVAFFHNLPTISSRYGVYAVPGNHDRTLPESNLDQLRFAMLDAGVTPLINSVSRVRIGSGSIWIAGVDDVNCGHPQLTQVASHVRKEDYVIFLCHSPAIIPEALATGDATGTSGWFDLGLFGHTHGGQVNLFAPLIRDDRVPEEYISGWSIYNRTSLLTSRGYGTSVLPIRLFCRPQIHLITLQSPD